MNKITELCKLRDEAASMENWDAVAAYEEKIERILEDAREVQAEMEN